MCVCVLPDIYSGRQTFGLTSRGHTGGRSHRISPSFFCGACLNFYREKVSVVPSSTVKSNFVYPRINRSRLVGHVFKEKPWGKKLFVFFFVRKNPSSYSTSIIMPPMTHRRCRGESHTTSRENRAQETQRWCQLLKDLQTRCKFAMGNMSTDPYSRGR